MPVLVRVPGICFHQRDELIAQIDEGLTRATSPQFKREYLPVKGQRRLDVVDFKRDVIETHKTRSADLCHGAATVEM
jgi:hypothetical protein